MWLILKDIWWKLKMLANHGWTINKCFAGNCKSSCLPLHYTTVCVSSSVRMRMLALWCKNWKSNTRKTTRDSAAIPLVLVAIATDKVTWHFGFYLGPVPGPGVVSHSKQIAVLLALVTRFVELCGIAAVWNCCCCCLTADCRIVARP